MQKNWVHAIAKHSAHDVWSVLPHWGEWFADRTLGFLSTFSNVFLLWLCAIHRWNQIQNLHKFIYSCVIFIPLFFVFKYSCVLLPWKCEKVKMPTQRQTRSQRQFWKVPAKKKVSQISFEAACLIDLFTPPGFNKRHQRTGYWSI